MRACTALAALAALAWATTAGATTTPPAQPSAAYTCREELLPMSDGVRLYGWVRESEPRQPRPVLLTIQLYTNNSCPGSGWTLISPAVEDQMTVVNVSARGTGPSEGLYDAWGPRSAEDVAAVIAWARTQPWSNGTIVLHGLSGAGQFIMHGLHEPGVAAAIPMSVCLDLYRCIFRESGVYSPLLGIGFLQLIVQGHDAGLETKARLGTGSNPPAAEQRAAIQASAQQIADNPVYNEQWGQRSAIEPLRTSSVPVFHTTSNFDLAQSWPSIQQTRDARISLGFGHSVPFLFTQSVPPRFDTFFRTPIDRFVEHYGLGIANDAENDDRVQLAVALGSVAEWHAGRMLVRHEPTWPLPGTRWTKLYFAPGPSGSAASLNDGRLLTAPVREPAGDPVPTVASLGSRGDLRILAAVNPSLGKPEDFELRSEEATALTYTSPPLAEALEVTGPIQATVYASSTVTDFDWMVRLTDVWPDGRSEWITDGQVRASLRAVEPRRSLRDPRGQIVKPWLGLDDLDPLRTGQTVKYRIPLYEVSNVFQAGHRIRVDLIPVARTGAGSGTITVARDRSRPSHVVLPVIPARCQKSTPLAGDEPVPTCASSYAEAAGLEATRPDRPRPLPVLGRR